MRLIIGGIYQGKEKYARTKYGDDIQILGDLVEKIKKAIELGDKEEDIIADILSKALKVDVVIALEAFGGLTPIDASTRKLVEIYGRLLEKLAGEAESVERVVCGLGQRLK